MKSTLLKFVTCLILALGLMMANTASAQAKGGKAQKASTKGFSEESFKAKADCVRIIANGKAPGSLSYNVSIDYGKGNVKKETHSIKLDTRKMSGFACKCYPGSESITVTYTQGSNIPKASVTEMDICK